MDTGSGMPDMGGMKQGAEVPVGLHFEELDGRLYKQHERAIKEMRFDPLDTSKNYSLETERASDTDTFFARYLASGTQGALFLAMDGDTPVAFVAVTLSPDNRTAVIDDIWLEEKNHQKQLLENVIRSTEGHLRQHGCESAILMAPSMSAEMKEVLNYSNKTGFYGVETGEDDASRHHLENAA